MLIDSHCHLDDEQFNNDRDEVVQRALDAGVTQMVAVGTGSGPPDLEAGIRLADKYPALVATVGVHPHDAAKAGDDTLKRLDALLDHPKVVAVGEIGLDYHYDFSPREMQRRLFVEQMQMAAARRRPIVIHTREAWDDTFALIEQHWAPHHLPGIMHCFSGTPAEAARALALGFFISFGGIVTFPKAEEVRQAALQTPLNRLLVETDAPYLAPVPKRGKRNEPAFVVHTAGRLAELRGLSYEELCGATSDNFQKVCCYTG
jgi:TatD DNase family protein